jgi:Rrf2 family protein
MMTMKAKYALKALGCLAATGVDRPLLISEIAAQEAIPRKFLELILNELKQHGFLRSKKGRGGGYLFAKDPERITIAAVLRVLEGPIAPVPCLSRTAYRRCDGCRDELNYSLRSVLKEAYEASVEVLERTTVADLARLGAGQGRRKPVLRYSI